MNVYTKMSFASKIGLALSLVGHLIISIVINLPQLETVLSPNAINLLGFLFVWILVGVLIFIVIRAEDRSLSSIGIKTITIKDGLLAVVLGIVLSLSVPALTLIVNQIIPTSEGGSIASVTGTVPATILLLGVLTAGITEEILYRGYPIERITEATGNKWLALAISVIAFTLPHTAGWNLAHIIGVVIPLGFILSVLYIWKRNLIFNMIVHILIDLPLVFIALASN
ncbi:MAG: CPBP family intramembrane metalloprotease [Chloroflexi bacterium]|nr:CPBP family intramembrane metalloprotease [Chloroflexota bacterium]